MFWRVRIRLALWSAVALAVIITLIGLAAYLSVRREVDREIDESIESARAEILTAGPIEVSAGKVAPVAVPDRSEPDEDGREQDDDDHDERHDDVEHAAGIATDVFFVTTDETGRVLANPRNIDLEHIPFGALQSTAGNGERLTTVTADDGRFRILTAFVPGMESEPDSWLHVGRSLEGRDRQLRTLAWVLAAGGLAGVSLSALGGLWLAGRALVPIRRALESQRRFVSDASHELRTPLASIKANSELLAMYPEKTVAENRDQVEAIAAEVDQMASLVEDLLTLARADEGRLPIRRELVDLGALGSEVVRDLEPLAAGKGVRIRTNLSGSPVTGDRQLLRQLATILLENAVKYTPEGGTVTLRCGNGEFSVADTGPGIAREQQQRLFDRFYRVDEARTRESGGTGLGLSIGRWIAEAHGGTVMVESTPGEGSVFTVRLPPSD